MWSLLQSNNMEMYSVKLNRKFVVWTDKKTPIRFHVYRTFFHGFSNLILKKQVFPFQLVYPKKKNYRDFNGEN